MTQYLKILKDPDIFPESKIEKPIEYAERQTVKAIVFNKKGEIALVTNPVHNMYLLPGGGAESNNLESEMIRECREEINQEVEITGMVGMTKEFRDRDAKEYITTCFTAKTIKQVEDDTRTEDEVKNCLNVAWVDKEKAMNIFEMQYKKVSNGEIKFYNTAFNIVRDFEFLKEYFRKEKL
jgi:ADP-ribose pyrophosphatase YjhB (NUDIX family)